MTHLLHDSSSLKHTDQACPPPKRHGCTCCYSCPDEFLSPCSFSSFPNAAVRFVEVQEMVMSGKADFRSAGKVHLVQRPIGQNTVGVVSWLLLLRTPECPDGRQVSATARNLFPCQFGCSLCWTTACGWLSLFVSTLWHARWPVHLLATAFWSVVHCHSMAYGCWKKVGVVCLA